MPTGEKAFDVFLSHSSHNKLQAAAICAKLEEVGIRCWVAPRDIMHGKPWPEAIIDGLDRCRAMVLVFSEHANQSSHVQREVERAASKELVIIPFRVEHIKPTGSMEYYLSSMHWLNAFDPPLEKHIAELIQSLRQLLGLRLSPPPLSPVPPPSAATAPLPASLGNISAPESCIVASPLVTRPAARSRRRFSRLIAFSGLIVLAVVTTFLLKKILMPEVETSRQRPVENSEAQSPVSPQPSVLKLIAIDSVRVTVRRVSDGKILFDGTLAKDEERVVSIDGPVQVIHDWGRNLRVYFGGSIYRMSVNGSGSSTFPH